MKSAAKPALVLIIAAAAILSSCQRETGPDPLELTGRIFVFNYRMGYATYLITLAKREPVADGSTVSARFENPAGGDPFRVDQKIFPAFDKIVLESPHIQCVKKDRPYAVTIEVRGADGKLLQTLETTAVSTVDQSVLPTHPLVIGPGYTPNPEIFKNGSTVPDLSETVACPGA